MCSTINYGVQSLLQFYFFYHWRVV